MNWPYELQIGWRYTRAGRAGRRNRFISFISGVSMLGIALGVAALIIVLSVMNGFQKEVRDRMLSVIAHIEIYDAQGQLLTGSLADYLVPTASDFPNLRAVVLESHPSPINPLGAKGAGEGGIIPVGGVMANAVANALGSFGVQPRELPLSPSRIWQLLEDARNEP